MIEKILDSISDFREQIKEGKIKVCLLRPYSKISTKGWAGFLEYDELFNQVNEEHNLGIALTGSTYPNEPFLTCIDIDGDKREINSINVESFTKEWVFNIISKKLDEKGISYMAVRSSSGGYHIYVYCIQESSRYGSCRDLKYPKDFDAASQFDDITMFLSANRVFAQELYGDDVPNGIVETWCTKRYMVAPGSDITDQKTGKTTTVTLLKEGVQTFKEIGIYEGDLNSLLREAMIENGFKESATPLKGIKKEFSYDPKPLLDKDIQMLGDFLLKYLPLIDGQKHTFCLALSGFLYSKQIDIESICKIGEYVTARSGDLFDSNKDFINTLLHDTKEENKARLTTGLPTMADILSPFISREILGKKLHLLTNPDVHKFWPDGTYANQYHEVIINFKDHYMLRNKMRTKITKDGEITYTIMNNNKIFNNIDYIEYINDITNFSEVKDWDRPVRVHFTKTDGGEEIIDFPNIESCINNYNKIQGSWGEHSKTIMENIINEFQYLDIIPEVEASSRPGIWYSENKRSLVRYINKNNEVVEQNPEDPDIKDLKWALTLIKTVNDVLPWKEGKFGYFIRTMFTVPYAAVMKYEYSYYHPYVLLYGESGTLKSTMSLLGINMHISFSKDDKDYVVPGAEMFSEYRFARNLDKSSFPLVVEEPAQLFSSNTIRELIKSSAYNNLIREPGGRGSRPYYSMRCPIFTINNLPNAAEKAEYIRRFISIEFERDEVCDTPEILENLAFLNKRGKINYEFKNLHYIGDYIFNLLNRHLDWFEGSIEEIQNHIIDNLESKTGINLDFLRVSSESFVYNDRSEYENNTLNSILKVLKRPYLYSRGKYISKPDSISTIKTIIKENSDYSYIHFVKQKDKEKEYILIDIGFKEAYNNYYINEDKTITLSNVINYLQDLDFDFDCLKMTPCYIEGRKKQVRGIKMSLDDFTKILTGKRDS